MTAIYAVANQKGGVGKTTTAAALIAVWADAGLRVLGVDLDPQGSLTSALGARKGHALFNLIEGYIDSEEVPNVAAVVLTLPTGEHLLPGHLDLAGTEAVKLANTERRDYVLIDLLETVAARYDVIVIDCPPSLGLLTFNALTAATAVLIPCTPEYLAAEGLVRLLDTVRRVQRRLNKELQIAGVVPTMVKTNTTHHRAMIEQIRAVCDGWPVPIPILDSVPDRISVADAAGQGVPVTRYDANGAAAAYRQIAQHLTQEAQDAR